ncbi:MAG: PQQ-binding-like beta-propeller repeat protein, partial [Thermodesulfobacteriota bacterium]|nr:PQQ-binding-like beta-propeller repeat protein [Thermodesulfobacteriota bacterium]
MKKTVFFCIFMTLTTISLASQVFASDAGTLKWTFAAKGDFSSPAIASDGTIYVTADNDIHDTVNGYLYAIDPNGTLKWSFSINLDVDDPPTSPLIGPDGTIYQGSRDNYLYAINSDGSLKWRYLTLDTPTWSWGLEYSPAISTDGIIYAVGGDEALHAINSDG